MTSVLWCPQPPCLPSSDVEYQRCREETSTFGQNISPTDTDGQLCVYGSNTCLIRSRGMRVHNSSSILSSKLGKWVFLCGGCEEFYFVLFRIQPTSLSLNFFSAACRRFFPHHNSAACGCLPGCGGVTLITELKIGVLPLNPSSSDSILLFLCQIIPVLQFMSPAVIFWTPCFVLTHFFFVSRRRMDCPQWTAMSQHPASLPTTLPPKCHPTWGTAPPPRPMWPDPRGSRPVAVLYLPTAVTSPALWPSRAWQPTVTPSTRSRPRRCEASATDCWVGRGREEVRDGEDRRQQVCPPLVSAPTACFLWRTRPSGTHFRAVPPPTCPPHPCTTRSDQRHTRNKQSVNFCYELVWKKWQGRCT